MDCIFCRIIARTEQAWIVYEDEHHLACLTPFPNTPGFTVLMSKEHLSSDVMALDDARYTSFQLAAKRLSDKIRKNLGVKRCGLVIEGMGVDHAHVKLIPMHGIPEGPWKPILSHKPEFHENYQGYIATHDGPRMSDEELEATRKKIAS